MGGAGNHRTLTAEVWFQEQTRPNGNCGRHCVMGTSFFRVRRFSLVNIIHPTSVLIFSSVIVYNLSNWQHRQIAHSGQEGNRVPGSRLDSASLMTCDL